MDTKHGNNLIIGNMMVNPTEFGVSPKFSDNTKFRLRKSSTLGALEETRDLSEVVFFLFRNSIIVAHADHSWRSRPSWAFYQFTLLLCLWRLGVCNYIYIYMYSNPKKYRKTVYSYFTTGSYQLLLYIYIHVYVYIYRYTHIHHQGLTDTRKAAAWKLQRTPGASVSARRE